MNFTHNSRGAPDVGQRLWPWRALRLQVQAAFGLDLSRPGAAEWQQLNGRFVLI
jgi:hypothetical protein